MQQNSDSGPCGSPEALDFELQYIPPNGAELSQDEARLCAERRDAGAIELSLARRGFNCGSLLVGERTPSPPRDIISLWENARPVFLPGLLAEEVCELEEVFDDSLAMFERLRDGARFLEEFELRVGADNDFAYSSSSFDHHDKREIEKIFVDVRPEVDGSQGPRIARDISAKLSWLTVDESDSSMRIRFSFGHEATRDWEEDPARTTWSEQLAEEVFPEGQIIAENPILESILETVLEAPYRLSERIIFNNAPGGGAMFHHDADKGQLGVVFAQLAGGTVWLALPKSELAATLVAIVPELGDETEVMARMEDADDIDVWRALNQNPRVTRALAKRGAFFALEPGDVLLMPSHSLETTTWHSVYGVGEDASLAHSYGIYPELVQRAEPQPDELSET